MKGKKYDQGKVRTDLVDPQYIIEVSKVLTHGANKYSANNWQKVDDGINRYYGALLRHILAWRNGEIIDKESGLKHLSHAATNLMFIEYLEGKNEI